MCRLQVASYLLVTTLDEVTSERWLLDKTIMLCSHNLLSISMTHRMYLDMEHFLSTQRMDMYHFSSTGRMMCRQLDMPYNWGMDGCPSRKRHVSDMAHTASWLWAPIAIGLIGCDF